MTLETAEHIASGLAHVIPVGQAAITAAKQTFHKTTIIAGIVHDGKEALHFVCNILTDDETKAALARVDLLERLIDQYAAYATVGNRLTKRLDSVKMWNIRQKHQLHSEISTWRNDVIRFKIHVMDKSDWARLGLNVETTSLQGESIDGIEIRPTTALPGATLPSASVTTLVALEWPNDTEGATDEDAILALDPMADTRSQYSATDSMHGNPWHNYEPKGRAATAEVIRDASRETPFSLMRLLSLALRPNARRCEQA
ncbi:hypothetical protein BD311DRAFT_752252 [Dichomitus squalens]|uniref:Uncharacterized protein n=1 Tax=Dichomitus squalens TaxID=114155 RepID=A0A4V2K174_9APHY|nr:hypothetical protein BD311DRAFT_752252 [Dichomitus squalens]